MVGDGTTSESQEKLKECHLTLWDPLFPRQHPPHPRSLAAQPLVTSFYHTSKLYENATAAAVNEEIPMTRGPGAISGCLCRMAAAPLVTSKFGLRACAGKLFLMRKKKMGTVMDPFQKIFAKFLPYLHQALGEGLMFRQEPHRARPPARDDGLGKDTQTADVGPGERVGGQQPMAQPRQHGFSR